MPVILGIDPGSQRTGFGLIEVKNQDLKYLTHGVIEISPTFNWGQRLVYLAHRLQELFETWGPQSAVVEKIFLGKNADSAFKLGQIRGVCIKESTERGITVNEYAARFVKKSITGSGASPKDEVNLVLSRLLKISSGGSLDASDALALAVCHSREMWREKIMEPYL